jgi:hypothetical protein
VGYDTPRTRMNSRPKFEAYKTSLRGLTEQFDILLVEKDACERLAHDRGATYAEIENAKQAALADPEIRQQFREDYAEMWKALDEAAQDASAEEILGQLPNTEKPN